MCLLLVVVVVFLMGNVTGTEFAPSHFQTREFSFYEIPFLHVQITPIKRKDVTGPAARQIRTNAWISAPRGKPPSQWHIVSLSRGPSTTPAIASLLTENISLRDANGPFWETWNKDHPKRAAVLWPIVQRLAERELYVLLPELLLMARTAQGPDDGTVLAAEIDDWLVSQYIGLIKDLRQADRHPLADQIWEEAVADHPDSLELAGLGPAKVQ